MNYDIIIPRNYDIIIQKVTNPCMTSVLLILNQLCLLSKDMAGHLASICANFVKFRGQNVIFESSIFAYK